MDQDSDSLVRYCDLCNKIMYLEDVRTVDTKTYKQYCSKYCCDIDRKRDEKIYE